ncbi:ABC transporter substrate-binding protein [Desulfopila aestuarii]|uniref:ABC transporter substrate-binding protein n=1 Tax=Desulfopila aestuarii TaxID=231440 RepID=UPI00135654A2|nr:ABC transporter substrate-binding protein [Desulfopila aestuarii]
MKVQLKWVHQAQFVGFYIALDEGYYDEENLDVTLFEGGPAIDQAVALHSGTVDFAVLPAEALLIKNSTLPKMVAISALYQLNPTVFVAKSDSGIINPKDLTGKIVAVGKMEEGGFLEGIIQFKAMLKNTGVAFDSIIQADYDPQYGAFINGAVDVTPAYMTGGVIKLQNQGLNLNLLWPGDYGVNAYGDTLATTDTYIAAHPDIVLRFLRATLKGWQKAIENQTLALATTMKYAKIQDTKLQEAMLDIQAPLVSTGDTPIGWMKQSVWQNMGELYKDSGNEERSAESGTFYTLNFLETIYGPQK